MGQDENPTGKFTTKPTTNAREIYRKGLGLSTTTAENFTVVYFMSDGEAFIRYEKQNTPSYLMREAFAVARVMPATEDAPAKLEWLKFEGDLSEMLQAITKAAFVSGENED